MHTDPEGSSRLEVLLVGGVAMRVALMILCISFRKVVVGLLMIVVIRHNHAMILVRRDRLLNLPGGEIRRLLSLPCGEIRRLLNLLGGEMIAVKLLSLQKLGIKRRDFLSLLRQFLIQSG